MITRLRKSEEMFEKKEHTGWGVCQGTQVGAYVIVGHYWGLATLVDVLFVIPYGPKQIYQVSNVRRPSDTLISAAWAAS